MGAILRARRPGDEPDLIRAAVCGDPFNLISKEVPGEGILRARIIAWDVAEGKLDDFTKGIRLPDSDAWPVTLEEQWVLDKGFARGSGHLVGVFHPIRQPEPARLERKVEKLIAGGFAPAPGREWPRRPAADDAQ